jgi:putative transcriptional regulator
VTPLHHPSEATLTAYAAGTLRAGFGLVVAAHLEQCAQCRSAVRACEAVGGALAEDLSPVAMESGAFERVLARLDEVAPMQPVAAGSVIDRLPVQKKRWAAPGVWVQGVDVPRDKNDRVYLLNVPPGGATAKHSHSGQEFTYVISGALRDGDTVFSAGDFVELDETTTHHPVVEGDAPCLCLFATEGRLKPQGWLGALAFRLTGV